MQTIRIGNDITVRWSFRASGVPYTLQGRDLILEVRPQFGAKFQTTDFTTEDNTLQWTFRGAAQSVTGVYYLTLIENRGKEGMVTVDSADAFRLVARAASVASQPTDENLTVEAVDLDTELLAQTAVTVPQTTAKKSHPDPHDLKPHFKSMPARCEPYVLYYSRFVKISSEFMAYDDDREQWYVDLAKVPISTEGILQYVCAAAPMMRAGGSEPINAQKVNLTDTAEAVEAEDGWRVYVSIDPKNPMGADFSRGCLLLLNPPKLSKLQTPFHKKNWGIYLDDKRDIKFVKLPQIPIPAPTVSDLTRLFAVDEEGNIHRNDFLRRMKRDPGIWYEYGYSWEMQLRIRNVRLFIDPENDNKPNSFPNYGKCYYYYRPWREGTRNRFNKRKTIIFRARKIKNGQKSEWAYFRAHTTPNGYIVINRIQ